MRRRTRVALISITLLAVAAVVIWLVPMGDTERRSADRIISKIEEYRGREGHLPDPADTALLQSLGFELSTGLLPDYQPLDSTDYVITILKGFDGPYWFYESKNQTWRRGFPPPRR